MYLLIPCGGFVTTCCRTRKLLSVSMLRLKTVHNLEVWIRRGILVGSWTCSEASPIQTDESGNQNNYLDITFEEEASVPNQAATSRYAWLLLQHVSHMCACLAYKSNFCLSFEEVKRACVALRDEIINCTVCMLGNTVPNSCRTTIRVFGEKVCALSLTRIEESLFASMFLHQTCSYIKERSAEGDYFSKIACLQPCEQPCEQPGKLQDALHHGRVDRKSKSHLASRALYSFCPHGYTRYTQACLLQIIWFEPNPWKNMTPCGNSMLAQHYAYEAYTNSVSLEDTAAVGTRTWFADV